MLFPVSASIGSSVLICTSRRKAPSAAFMFLLRSGPPQGQCWPALQSTMRMARFRRPRGRPVCDNAGSGCLKPGGHADKIRSLVSVNELALLVDRAINVQVAARNGKDHVLFGRAVSDERQNVVVDCVGASRLSLLGTGDVCPLYL